MRNRTRRRYGIAAGTALALLLPLVSGCGGAPKDDTGGGSYFTGTMKGKGAPPSGGGAGAKAAPGAKGSRE